MANLPHVAVVDLSGSKAEGNLAQRLWIEGVGDFEVTQFTTSSRLNEMPRAVCLVPTGRLASERRGIAPARVHRTLDQLRQMRRAKVYLRPQGEWAPGVPWPGDERVVFDGYYVGYGLRVASGKQHAVLHLVHWLADLSMSSSLSARQHPVNPGALFHPATEQGRGTGQSGQAAVPKNVTLLFDRPQIQNWMRVDILSGVKNVLCRIAQEDRFEPGTCGVPLAQGAARPNKRAIRALSRIEGDGGDCSRPYDYAAPVRPVVADDTLAASLADAMTDRMLGVDHGSTFWDILIQLVLPELQLSLVPLVERALIVADAPLQRQTWKTIRAGDYSDYDFSGILARPLRGVGIYGDFTLETQDPAASTNAKCLGGVYPLNADPADDDGVWLFQPAPSWLQRLPFATNYAAQVNGLRNGNPPPPDRVNQEVGIPAHRRYAHAVYVANQLRGRTGTLSGKLRFDVCPGSVVRIESQGERFLFGFGLDQTADSLYAQVTGVSHHISAESRAATTTIEFGHARTAAENADDRTSFDGHPLYQRPLFVGAPLVADKNDLADRGWAFQPAGTASSR